jgi:hypothetical protein
LEGGGAGTSCSQSTTYLAAVTGLSNAEQNAYNVAICGMVFDGDFAGLDGLYIYANASAANATVNAKAPGTHNITTHGHVHLRWIVGLLGIAILVIRIPGLSHQQMVVIIRLFML